MKKTAKVISIISIFVIIISTLCACQISFGNDQTTTTAPSTSTENTTTTSTTTSAIENKVETDSLDTILNLIKDCPIGTAGSTTKAVQIAVRLLNFTENSNYDLVEVKNDFKNFMNTLSDSQKVTYVENFIEIDYIARKIIEDPTFPEKYLNDYEDFSEDGKISLDNYETLYEVISE